MKKIVFILILLFSFGLKISAETTLDLGEPIISFPKEDDYVLQGFTTVRDNLFTVFINDKEDKPVIKVFDLDTYELVKTVTPKSVGHANDVAYNSKENKIYVVNGNGLDSLHVFDGDSFEYINTINIYLSVRSLAYMDTLNAYAVRTVSNGYFLNQDFKRDNRFPFLVALNFMPNVARQGWEFHNDMLYYSTWSWVKYGGDGSNSIHVFDLEGNTITSFKTENDVGELENVAFYNEKMILGFNSYDERIDFYAINDIEIHKPKKKETKKESKNQSWIVFTVIGVLIIGGIIVFLKKQKKM